jgi:hypothetical protein
MQNLTIEPDVPVLWQSSYPPLPLFTPHLDPSGLTVGEVSRRISNALMQVGIGLVGVTPAHLADDFQASPNTVLSTSPWPDTSTGRIIVHAPRCLNGYWFLAIDFARHVAQHDGSRIQQLQSVIQLTAETREHAWVAASFVTRLLDSTDLTL